MENISISLQEVSQCAAALRQHSFRILEGLLEIKREMNELNQSWISESGTSIVQRFNQFSNRFEVQKEVIERYSKFLDFTVSSYDTLETTLHGNASNF